MVAFTKTLLTPTLTDPDLARRQHVLSLVLLGMLIPCTLYALAMVAFYILALGVIPGTEADETAAGVAWIGALAGFSGSSVYMVAFALGRKGYLRTGGLLATTMLFLIMAAGGFQLGLGHSVMIGYAMTTVVAGVLINPTASLAYLALCTAAHLAVGYAQTSGMLPDAVPPEATYASESVSIALGLLVIVAIHWVSNRELERGLARERDLTAQLKQHQALLEQRVEERTQELAVANGELARSLAELRRTQSQLVAASRRAGMADVATAVLHDVGNVLTNTSVSAELAATRVRTSACADLAAVVALLKEHARDLPRFLAADPRGKSALAALDRLAAALSADRDEVLGELERLLGSVERIQDIVAAQAAFDTERTVRERCDLAEVVDDVVSLHAERLSQLDVQLEKAIEPHALVLDRAKLSQVLGHLVENAIDALATAPERHLVLRAAAADGRLAIRVEDTGQGIPEADRAKVFNLGFTTREGKRGFGLHHAALAAQDLGGSLRCEGPAAGGGASFVLELPLAAGECGEPRAASAQGANA